VALAVIEQKPEPPNDAKLIEQAKSGDEEAYAQIYKRHVRRIAGVVYRLLGSDHQLEDIVQETFVIGLGQLGELREPDALGGWLRTIAVRRVQRHLAGRYKQRALGDALSAAAPRVSTPAASEEIVALYQALATLPDKIRLPWMLHHIEGETLPAVADMCETSLTSVKRHIAKAKEHLRRLGHGD
jgi:RNA polymerase sigma-70 factor (ECF subfamily)